MAKRGRRIVEVIKSLKLSSILFSIASGNNYANSVAEKFNVDRSSTRKQFLFLEEKGFIKKEKGADSKYGRVRFEIVYPTIIKEWILYLKQFDSLKGDELKLLSEKEQRSLKIYHNHNWAGVRYYSKEKFYNSPALKEYFKVLFQQIPLMTKTLEDLFIGIILHPPPRFGKRQPQMLSDLRHTLIFFRADTFTDYFVKTANQHINNW